MRIRPSDLYHIGYGPDDPARFWFDRAVMRFGAMVEEDLRQASSRAKNDKAAASAGHRRLLKWLDFDGKMTKQRFASPQVTKTRRE